MPKQVVQTIGLTENQVQDLFNLLDQFDDQEAYLSENEERRAYERFPFQLRSNVNLQLVDKVTLKAVGDTYQVRMRNLSCGGVSLLHGVDIDLGQPVILQFPGADNLTVDGTVTHIRQLIGPISEYGITFIYPIDINQLLTEEQMSDRSMTETA